MEKGNVVSLEDRIPKLRHRRKKRANKRAIMLLLVFFILLILVLYFLSPLSDINKIEVSGNQYVTDEIIISSSGLSKETSIWKVDKEKVTKKLKKLPEIDTVSISVKMPNTVEIEVTEYHRLGYVVKGSEFLPIVSSGVILDALENGMTPVHAPLLIGFKEGKALKALVEALDKLPEEINNAISEIHYTPTDSDEYHLTLYMNDGYEVSATSRTLAEKLVYYPSIVSQLDGKVKGIIDLNVGSYFTPYDGATISSEEQVIDEGGQDEGEG